MTDKERVYLKDGKMGIWRTVGGNRIFIPLGKTLSEAMIESGKYPNYQNKSIINVAEKWKRNARPKYGAIENLDWCIAHDGTIVNSKIPNGKLKTISEDEAKTGTWFKNHIWGDCKMQPGIDIPQFHKSADIRLFGQCGLIEEQTVEIKSIQDAVSLRAIDSQIHNGSKQSENILLDIKKGALSDFSDDDVLQKAISSMKSRKEAQTVIIKRGEKLIAILQRQ